MTTVISMDLSMDNWTEKGMEDAFHPQIRENALESMWVTLWDQRLDPLMVYLWELMKGQWMEPEMVKMLESVTMSDLKCYHLAQCLVMKKPWDSYSAKTMENPLDFSKEIAKERSWGKWWVALWVNLWSASLRERAKEHRLVDLWAKRWTVMWSVQPSVPRLV